MNTGDGSITVESFSVIREDGSEEPIEFTVKQDA